MHLLIYGHIREQQHLVNDIYAKVVARFHILMVWRRETLKKTCLSKILLQIVLQMPYN